MEKDQIVETLKDYFLSLKDIYDIDFAFLYGSRACGNPMKDSDIDIAVLYTDEVSEDEVFEKVDKIALELTEKLKQETNILYIDHEISKPMLHYNAIIHGIPIFIRDFTKYVDIRFKAISQMEDFSIFGTKWQVEIVRRRLETLAHG